MDASQHSHVYQNGLENLMLCGRLRINPLILLYPIGRCAIVRQKTINYKGAFSIMGFRIDYQIIVMVDKKEEISDDEIARRMERGIRRFLNTPPQPHGKNPKTPPTPKPEERPASKGRVHKGKTRN
jgi:hypothetical protein